MQGTLWDWQYQSVSIQSRQYRNGCHLLKFRLKTQWNIDSIDGEVFRLLLETAQDEGESQPPMIQQLVVQTSLAFAGLYLHDHP